MNNNSNAKNLFASNNSLFGNNSAMSLFAVDNPVVEEEKNDKQKWINDVDSELILENIDNTAKNKVVKIKLKLQTLEKTLARIDEELKILQLFNLEQDKSKRDELLNLKHNIENQISQLHKEKKQFGIFYILAAYTNNKITYENIKFYTDKFCNFVIMYYSKLQEYIKNKIEKRGIFKN